MTTTTSENTHMHTNSPPVTTATVSGVHHLAAGATGSEGDEVGGACVAMARVVEVEAEERKNRNDLRSRAGALSRRTRRERARRWGRIGWWW